MEKNVTEKGGHIQFYSTTLTCSKFYYEMVSCFVDLASVTIIRIIIIIVIISHVCFYFIIIAIIITIVIITIIAIIVSI